MHFVGKNIILTLFCVENIIFVIVYQQANIMRHIYLALAAFIFNINFIVSQDLYVGDNSALYAKDIVLFVNNDIRLETATSNLYLRGDAQLIQNVDIKNSDAGSLSVYQDQNANVYAYNYWCSPVGLGTDGTANANVSFFGSNIYDPQDEADIANVNSTPYGFTTAYNATTSALSNYWIHTYKDGEGYYSWKRVSNTGAVGTGYGFTLKGSPNINNVLDFRGRPNNGTITITCNYDGTDDQPNSGVPNTANTLTGNPYPSTLDLKLFLANATNQTSITGEIFFWEQKQISSHYLKDYEGGYGVYTPGNLSDLNDNGTYAFAPFSNYTGEGGTIGATSGTTSDFSLNNQRRFAAIGQGFMVQSNGSGGNVIFDNSMRTYITEDSSTSGSGSVFAKGNGEESNEKKIMAMSHNGVDYQKILKNPTVIPEIRLIGNIADKFFKEFVIAFRKSTPDNDTYNRFFDGSSINLLKTDAYIYQSDKKLAIKSINYNPKVTIPFGFEVENDNTTFRISIKALNDIPRGTSIYMYDKLNETYTDLRSDTFNTTLNTGVFNDRFEIVFNKPSKVVVKKEKITSGPLNVFHNPNTLELTLLNPSKLNIKQLTIYDMSGKQVFSKSLNSANNRYTIPTKGYSEGMYIVKVQTDTEETLNKKVIFSSSSKRQL